MYRVHYSDMFELSESQKRNLYIGVAISILLSVVGYIVYIYRRPKLLTEVTGSDSSNDKSSKADAELIFFFADWCPHCKKAMPQWEEVKSSYSGKVVNGYTLIFTEVDCSKETDEMKKATAEYEIEGYPTIKLVKDGQIIEYDAKPDKDTLEKFINTVV
jgi:thiol-disulfide isomerase/thioredoxin